MTYTDFASEARKARNETAGYYRRARKDAQRAEDCYRTAASRLDIAAWMTRRPEFCAEFECTPADAEAQAASWVRLGDLLLQSSFRETEHARSSAERQRRYEQWDAEQTARINEWLNSPERAAYLAAHPELTS